MELACRELEEKLADMKEAKKVEEAKREEIEGSLTAVIAEGVAREEAAAEKLASAQTEITRVEGELNMIQQSASDTGAALLQTQADNRLLLAHPYFVWPITMRARCLFGSLAG